MGSPSATRTSASGSRAPGPPISTRAPPSPSPPPARLRARRPRRDRRGQPAPALLGDAGDPGARRRARAALPGLHREGDGVHRRPRRGAVRGRRGPGAGGQAPAREGAGARGWSTSSTTTRAACALQGAGPPEPGRPPGARAKFDASHPGYFDTEVAKGGRTTSRSSATRRARPASRRARCCPTAT